MIAIPAPVRRLLQAVGINRAVGYLLIGQGANILLQPLQALLIASCLTTIEQGYYFVFGAIIGLQQLFDVGFGMAMLQFASHEAGHLTWTPEGRLEGDPAAKSRLASILRLSLAWNCTVALILVAVLLPGGWVYFLRRDTPGVSWAVPWVCSVIVTAGGLLATPLIHFISGIGRVTDAAKASAIQAVGTSAVMCLALAGGAKLFSWPTAQIVGLAIIAVWLAWFWYPTLVGLVRIEQSGPKVSWRREVWPFQWRVALSALAFYLTSRTFSLVLFDDTAAGKVEAGRMGFSLMIMAVLTTTALLWIGCRAPFFGQLVARREWDNLDRMFGRLFVQTALVAAAAAVAVWFAFQLLRSAGYQLGFRVLPPLPFALILANVVVQTMVNSLNAYLRAHKMEPFLWTFLALGVVMLVAVLTVGRTYGSLGMAASLLFFNTVICLGGGGLIFLRCRRAWHAA